MAKRRKFSWFTCLLCSFLALIIGAILGFGVYSYINFPDKKTDSDVYVSGDLQIHFLELGNKYTGDCTYIKAGDTDILIDAGSRSYADNVSHISNYINQYITDGKLEYVIATHADRDHIACFGMGVNGTSLFDLYDVDLIIDFAKTNKDTDVYNNYVRERDDAVQRGATHYTALECWNETDGAKRVYQVSRGIEMEILYNYYYEHESDDENNYSVCTMFNQGDKHFLFTGDLELEGEQKFVAHNPNLPQVELFKAGHHGSKTSSNDFLLSIIQPKICAVCCCTGSPEYGAHEQNTFPTQAFIDRIAQYTKQVYVTTLCVDYENNQFTSMNGNIKITSTPKGTEVECSNNNLFLKDTDWFKNNRICPPKWK